jgi:hypothetical protein
VPFALPTFTTCTLTWPVEVEAVEEEVVVAAGWKSVLCILLWFCLDVLEHTESRADAQSRQGEGCELHIDGLTKIQILNECGDMYMNASSAVSCWPTIKITRSEGNVSIHLRPNKVKEEKNERKDDSDGNGREDR